MKLQISTKDHGVITSDDTNKSTTEIYTFVDKALTDSGYLRFYVKGVLTVVPYGVLNTSTIKIVD